MKQISALLLLIICLALPVIWPYSEANILTTTESTSEGRAVAGTDKTTTAVPIIMYHSLLKDVSLQNKFVISPDLLEQDILYLTGHGYTTITMTELIDHVNTGSPLPEKPVILTFDDGYYNNYYYGYPLFQKYNVKAVISVVGTYTEQFSNTDDNHPNYSHLTWNQLKEMSESGLVEIQNHTYDLHSVQDSRKGAGRMVGETDEQYRSRLSRDVIKMQELLLLHCDILPNTFTYPYGEISEGSDEILKNLGFEATLGCYEKTNWISSNGDETQLFQLGRYLRPNHLNSSEYFTRIGLL